MDPLFKGKLAQVDFILWCGNKIDQLTNLRLECRFQEQLEDVHIRRFVSEIDLEEVIDGCLEHERIVDCNVPHMWNTIPAWLTPSGYRCVHHIICDKEVRLEKFDTPSKNRGFEKLFRRKRTTLQDFECINDRDAPIEFSMWRIIAQVL